MTKICIATAGYYHPHETQIDFHVRNLFQGNSVVLHQRQMLADPIGRAHLAWAPPKLRRLNKLRSIIAHRTTRVPYGAQRREIVDFLTEHSVDAVLAEFGNVALRVAPVANVLDIPIFTYFRGADASYWLRKKFRAAGYRHMMPRLSGVFSVAQFLLDELSAQGIAHPNSHVVPSGVNTDLFVPAEKRPGSFLAVGRFVEKKRPDITVRAFCQVAEHMPHATLELVGNGPMLETCKAIVKDANLTDRIIFHGAQPHDVVREKLMNSEVFLQHSVRAENGNTEGLPTAIQEAMSCGMAVVSTRHAGIPEAVIEGENGYLVAEGDLQGFAAAIQNIGADREKLARISELNRAKAVDQYDNRKLIKVVEREISAAIAARAEAVSPRGVRGFAAF